MCHILWGGSIFLLCPLSCSGAHADWQLESQYRDCLGGIRYITFTAATKKTLLCYCYYDLLCPPPCSGAHADWQLLVAGPPLREPNATSEIMGTSLSLSLSLSLCLSLSFSPSLSLFLSPRLPRNKPSTLNFED